jgi:hypothetical protein
MKSKIMLWSLALFSLVTGCSYAPGKLTDAQITAAQMTRYVAKKDYPLLQNDCVLLFNPKIKKEQHKNKTIAKTTSLEIILADDQERITKIYYDADASGSLLDDADDILVLFKYVPKDSLPTLKGETVKERPDLKALITTYGRDYFVGIDGKKWMNAKEPVMKEHYVQSRVTATYENKQYSYIRKTVLPAETKKRFRQNL